MTVGELAIVIEGRREDWPGGARTLTPRVPTREPNGTFWFGAELDPDGGQVSGSPGRPSAGCRRKRPGTTAGAWSTPLIVCDHAGPPARARPQPLRDRPPDRALGGV